MSRRRATDPVRVGLGECECPDKPHEEDEAWLRPRLKVEDALAAMAALGGDDDPVSLGKTVGMIFLVGGLVRWNLLDDDGPIPVEAVTDGSMDWETTLKPIVDEASNLYAESLMRPLLPPTSKSLRRGQTSASTSQRPSSTRKRRKR